MEVGPLGVNVQIHYFLTESGIHLMYLNNVDNGDIRHGGLTSHYVGVPFVSPQITRL